MQNDCQRIQTWTPRSVLCIVRRRVFGEALSQSLLWWINKCGTTSNGSDTIKTQNLESSVDQRLFVEEKHVCLTLKCSGFILSSHLLPPGVSALFCVWKKGLFDLQTPVGCVGFFLFSFFFARGRILIMAIMVSKPVKPPLPSRLTFSTATASNL